MILGATIRLKDQFSGTMNKAMRDTASFRKTVEQTHTKMKVLGTTKVQPIIKIKDQASQGISKIKGGLVGMTGAAMAAVAAIVALSAGIGKAVSGAMKLEQQKISMEHFIGIQNKGMTPEDIKKQSDEYIGWMRNYANLTPFSTNEVIAGGSRAVNVAGGDINKAKELVKIAGDMAALNPEKTFSDAMEALADLRVGETERMKEFGFKISQDDIKKAGGIDEVINKQIQPFFKGGAEKLSASGAGLWSTITGNLGTGLTTIGEGILKGLKPQLQGIVSFMDQNGGKITAFATAFGQGIGKGITTVSGFVKQHMPQIKAGIATVMDWLGPRIDWVRSKIPFLRSVWETAWPAISSVLKTAWKIVGPILDLAWSAIKILWSGFEAAWPSIVKVVETAWAVLEPIFNALGKGLGLIAKGVRWVAEKFDASPTEIQVAGMGDVRGHAAGLPRVPFDNYPALLHRGEGVLTAAENRQYRNGGNSVQPVFNITVNGVNMTAREIVDTVVNEIMAASRNMGAAAAGS